MYKILVVEDDTTINQVICEFLKEFIGSKIKFEYDEYVNVIKNNITKSVYKFIEEIDVEDYMEDYEIPDVIESYIDIDKFAYDREISTIEEWIKEEVYKDIKELTDIIPKKFIMNLDIKDSIEILSSNASL